MNFWRKKPLFLLLFFILGIAVITAVPDQTHFPAAQAEEQVEYIPQTSSSQTASCYAALYPHIVYLPLISVSNYGPVTTPAVPLPPPEPVSAIPPVNFPLIRTQLQSQGLDLVFNKIGFHVGSGGNITGLNEWMRQLDAACQPIFLKSADSGGPLWEAQELMKVSGVPHTLVFRRSVPYQGADPIDNPDVPDYNLTPAAAAKKHWEWHKAGFPPELDPAYVWFETVNEVDKNRAEWMGQFALETAKLTMAEGYRWAAFGWSSGEPEPWHWETPSMLAFLRLAGENPDKLAIALHEYSFTNADIGNIYPYLIGRFQTLFDICDRHGIPRPTVMITEWGWEYNSVPDVSTALTHIKWAAWLYAAYPEVKGAAIWYLGPGFGGIADEAQKLITPLRDYSLSNYFVVTPGKRVVDPQTFQP